MKPYHAGRTVEWGNWGINFFDKQWDLTKNFGVYVGSVYFPISTRGPFVGNKRKYEAMCKAWIESATVPEGIVESRS